jgi:hypothetical protein
MFSYSYLFEAILVKSMNAKTKCLLVIFVLYCVNLSADVIGINTDKWVWWSSNKYRDGFRLIQKKKDNWDNVKIENEAILIRDKGYIDVAFDKTIDIAKTIIKVENPDSAFFHINESNNSHPRITVTKSSSIIADYSDPTIANKNIYLTEVTDNSAIIEKDTDGKMFLYMQENARLSDCYLKGINSVVALGSFREFYNVDFVNTSVGMYNIGSGRIDRYRINIPSTRTSWMSRLGTENGGDNCFYDWNPVAIDKRRIIHESMNSRYYQGYTATYKFIDKYSELPVEGVTVIYRDDREHVGGAKKSIGVYYTNVNGVLMGSINSKNSDTIPYQLQPTLHILTFQTVPVTTVFNLPAVGTSTHAYTMEEINSELDIKSYKHQRIAKNYSIDAEIGRINNDNSVKDYDTYYLKTDEAVTNIDIDSVMKYQIIETTEQLYDRSKAEWVKYVGDLEFPVVESEGGILYVKNNWNLSLGKNYPETYKVDFGSQTIFVKSNILDKTMKFNRIKCPTGIIAFEDNSKIDFPYSDKIRDAYVRITDLDTSQVLSISDEFDNIIFDGYSGEFGYAYKSKNAKHKILLKMDDGTESMRFYDLNNTGIENIFRAGYIKSKSTFTNGDRFFMYSIDKETVDNLETDPEYLNNIYTLLMYLTKSVQKNPESN